MSEQKEATEEKVKKIRLSDEQIAEQYGRKGIFRNAYNVVRLAAGFGDTMPDQPEGSKKDKAGFYNMKMTAILAVGNRTGAFMDIEEELLEKRATKLRKFRKMLTDEAVTEEQRKEEADKLIVDLLSIVPIQERKAAKKSVSLAERFAAISI